MGEFNPAEDGRKLVAEFIGTFTLIFVAAGSVAVTGGTNLVATALAYGLAFAFAVSALGHISNGFFNPAVTIGLWATRRMETLPGILYIIAQLLGGVAGGARARAALPRGDPRERDQPRGPTS